MCYRYTYKYGTRGNPVPRYRRKYLELDGKRPMLTRYTHEIALASHWSDGSRVEGPRGGKAVREFARYVWYADGRFYRVERASVGAGEYTNALVPIDGAIWDCHKDQSSAQGVPIATIECNDGYPVNVTLDGAEYRMDQTMWPMCEELLYLDGRRCPNGRIQPIYAEAVA